MANTYSSWEYSQGPTLYIDSSGFETIDENKNFTYFYLVTYSPVEYKRKVTDSNGVSTYEYKYSFGTDNSSRKVLERCTFTGKDKLTKTVTHTITEDGHKDTIVKTFYIDTNINSNIQDNAQIEVDPSYKVYATNMNNQSLYGIPWWWWRTVTKTGRRACTGYRYETYSSYESYTVRYISGYIHYHICWDGTGGGGRIDRYEPIYSYRTEYRWVTRSYRVSYTYYENYTYRAKEYATCKLNIKKIRDIVARFVEYASAVFTIKTKYALNKVPNIYIYPANNASLKKKLSCKQSGSASAGSYIEYYLPLSYIVSDFKSYNELIISIDENNGNATECYTVDAFAYIEIEASAMYYVNLLIQAYNRSTDTWSTVCTVPYLNFEEIDAMRDTKQHISKNLFFPIDLPKTDTSYRVKLATNLVAKETEMFTNFRLDVLADQLIPPGSITDHKLFINNDDLEHETEIIVDEVDELRLNILGTETYAVKTYPGFLKQGANDIHAYLRNTVTPIDETIPSENISKNVWHDYICSINGNWISNQKFIANTFDFPQVNILQGNDPTLENNIISFEIPYNNLKPNSTYTLNFTANAEQAFIISGTNTVKATDESKIAKSKLITVTEYDNSKVSVDEVDVVFYSPKYKMTESTGSVLVSEIDMCDKDTYVMYTLRTKDIDKNDGSKMYIHIKTKAVKNIAIKELQCICLDSNGNKYLDITEPHNLGGITEGRKYETRMTLYYDGFNLEHINPLLFKDMCYLREQLDKIRADYTIEPYSWSNWANKADKDGNVVYDSWGHPYGVDLDQPLRAMHFNDVKQCCVDTYEKLLELKPPVLLNTSPSMFRNSTGLIPLVDDDESQGYVLQHYQDKLGNIMEVDKYFPEWKQIINLINRN